MKNQTRNNRLSKTRPGRLLALVLVSALLLDMLPSDAIPVSKATEKTVTSKAAKASYGLNNPTTDSNGVTTWDTVYFGNYWQNDTNGDGTADKNDAKEPIKWRVLSVNGDDAFLLADQNLDCQRYNSAEVSVTWETCTMRSWLNGYGAGSNVCEKDYTSDNFLDNAFSSGEQAAIQNTTVVNADNPSYNTEGGNDTTDKVYLLSINEVLNPGYGFTSTTGYTKTRRARNTAYVANGGEIDSSYMRSAGSSDDWWLRSPGHDSDNASHVSDIGYVIQSGYYVPSSSKAVRPALHLNLSSASGWSYAGTVTSEGGQTTTVSPTPGKQTAAPESKAAKNIAGTLPDMSSLGSAELKGPELSIAGNKFNLFKTKINMNLPLFGDKGSMKVSVNESERTAEVLLGLDGDIKTDPNDPYWQETYQQVKSLVKACGGEADTTKLWNQFSKVRGKLKKIDADAVFKVSGNVAGYMKFQLDENDNPVSLLEGGITAGLEASGKTKVPLWWIVYSEFGVGGEVNGKISLKLENTKTIHTEGELGLAIKPSVALGADAVVVDIKGGIEGKIGGKVNFPWKSFQESVNAYLTGKAFIKVDTIVPGLSGGYDFNFPNLELYPNLGQITTRSLNAVQYKRSVPPTKKKTGQLRRYAAGAVDETKDALVYENAKPELVQLTDGRILMTYLDDTVTGAGGQAKLMYRLYKNGTWSEAKPVNANNNLDTAGKLCVHKGTAYVIYENSRNAVTEEMTQKDILDGMSLYVAAFDTDTNGFQTSEKIGAASGDTWKYGYDFVRDAEHLYAVWAENSEGDVLLESGNTDICRSSLGTDGWGAKETMHSENGAVQEFCVRIKNGACQTIYTKDGELYIDGQKAEISGERADSVKEAGNTVYFRVDGQLYNMDEEDTPSPLGISCTTSYRIADGAVYWTEQDNFKSELYRAALPAGENIAAEPVKLTDEGGYIGSFSVLERASESPFLAYTFQQVNEAADGENPYGLTLLKATDSITRNQAEVTNIAYDVLSFTPGEKNDIAVTVENTGTTELNHVKVVIRDKEGNVLHEEEVAASLQPGKTMEVTLSVPIPETFEKESITASVSADETFAKEESAVSRTELQASTADLQLTAKDADTLVIKNASDESAENVTLVVRDGSEVGSLLKEETAGTLKAGETKEISVSSLWSRTTANTLSGQNYLYCEVSQDAEEFELWNNSVQLAKESGEVPPEESEEPATPSPAATKEPAGTASPLPTKSPSATETPAVTPKPLQTSSPSPTASPDATKKPGGTPSGTGTLPVQPGQTTVTPPQGLTPAVPVVTPGTPSASAPVPAEVTGLKLKSKKNAIQASWKKTTGANGYQLWYSTSKKWKKKKSKTTKKTKLTIGKLKRKKTYFVRVRAYTVRNGKKVYGKWSRTLKKKVK